MFIIQQYGNQLTENTRDETTKKVLSKVLNNSSRKSLSRLVKELKKKGGKHHLLMFLSGKGGSGKSFTINTIERYCHQFCQYVSVDI